MAFQVKSFKLREKSMSGDNSQNVKRWIMEVEDATEQEVVDWLIDPNAVIPSDGIDGPDGVARTSWTAGYGPVWDNYLGLPLDSIGYDHLRDREPELWEITATYKTQSYTPILPQTGTASNTFSYDVGPESGVIKRSINTVASYGLKATPAVDPPDQKGLINVQPDGTVEGVSIPDAATQFSLAMSRPASFYNPAKLRQLLTYRGAVNSNQVILGGAIFQPGEVRFMGATGSVSLSAGYSGDSNLELRFGCRENEILDTDTVWTDIKGPISVRGWDVVWVKYDGDVDGDGNTISKPIGVYVEQIFPYKNLNNLFY